MIEIIFRCDKCGMATPVPGKYLSSPLSYSFRELQGIGWRITKRWHKETELSCPLCVEP